MTNNSTKGQSEYVKKCAGLGIQAAEVRFILKFCLNEIYNITLVCFKTVLIIVGGNFRHSICGCPVYKEEAEIHRKSLHVRE